MTTTQTAFKTVRRSKYANFDERFEHVPVQYGNLSKKERRCYELGHMGSVSRQGEIYGYFRICDDQKGHGRFWMMERFEWKGRVLTFVRYISYKMLPKEIIAAIESNGETVWFDIPKDELMSDMQKARMARDEDFFKMKPEQLLDYLNAYQLREPRANDWDEGNALDDIIFRYDWECVDDDSTKKANEGMQYPMNNEVVVLKAGERLVRHGRLWDMEAKQ